MTALVVVIFILCALIAWMDHQARKERKSMLNAILAKDNKELVSLELTDKTTVKADNSRTDDIPDLVRESELDDDTWEKLITEDKE